MSPMMGIFLTRLSSVVAMRPPMMMVWPLWALTVVLALRWLMMGTEDDLLTCTLELLMALLVVPISIFTKPSGLIFGVTVRFTPTSS